LSPSQLPAPQFPTAVLIEFSPVFSDRTQSVTLRAIVTFTWTVTPQVTVVPFAFMDRIGICAGCRKRPSRENENARQQRERSDYPAQPDLPPARCAIIEDQRAGAERVSLFISEVVSE
jgi:hypothetical protein